MSLGKKIYTVNEMPLYGLRVVDLGRVWSGPLVGRILADFGAEVIRVEQPSAAGRRARADPGLIPDFPDGNRGERPWNRLGMFNDLNRNKLSLTLDLTVPSAVEIFKKLVRISDVVVENYSPRVMSNLGLDYSVLRVIKEDIIMISMPGFGMTGPYRDRPAYGTTIQPIAGLTSLMGYPGGPPERLGVAYGDPIAGLHGVSAVLVALWHRQQTGKGQYIDLCQAETQTSTIGEVILGYGMNKKVPPVIGNRHPYMAPHGCYRCKGDDMWVTIAISSDKEWKSFCQVIGSPLWTKNERFADQLSRWENQDELDGLIQDWTCQCDHYEVMHILQTVGVACGSVLTGKEMLNDPHLIERGFIVEIAHPDVGTRPYAGVPMKLSKTPVTFRSPAPCLGEHNDYVLGELLGLSNEEITQLEENKATGIPPPEPLSS